MTIIRYTAPFFSSDRLINSIINEKSWSWPPVQPDPMNPNGRPLSHYADRRVHLLVGPRAKETVDLLMRAYGGNVEVLEDTSSN